ncbi:MAG: DUF4290 domain-containing protein [Bacteroidales bacterium]|nr:DUF4290 domain-containing protein [Bacteroidales bacterium]
MEYNSTRSKLIMREYGRNIQKMVEFAMTVEEKEKRNEVVRSIISVMGQLHTHLRDVTDFKHKLWDHLFIISDFNLDVDSPYPVIKKQDIFKKPERISYSNPRDIKFRYYGKTIDKIIQKVSEMEDNPEKEMLINVIANHLKKSYLTWNRESVTDDLINEHLGILSNGKLKLSENMRLYNTSDILARNKRKKKTNTIGSSNTNSNSKYSNHRTNNNNHHKQ